MPEAPAPTSMTQEALSLELKSWLDPSRPEHLGVLMKGLIALRNHGGGMLMIGFHDNGRHRTDDPKFDVAAAYRLDIVQELVSRHASDSFEVTVTLLDNDGRHHPRIEVPAGIRTPVRVRRAVEAIRDGVPFVHLAAGSVPVRTLDANGRASTAEAGRDDWERLMQTCFDNREADVARFIRRHLNGVAPAIADLVQTVRRMPLPDGGEAPVELLTLGQERFAAEFGRSSLTASATDMLGWGAREAALVIVPAPVGFNATRAFLNRIVASAPRLTSYPPLADAFSSSGGGDAQVRQGRWEVLIHHEGMFDLLSFALLDPAGRFYERRLNLLDVIARRRGATPRMSLGERQAITDIAETMVTGLAFAEAMGVADEHHELQWAFHWSGLKGRLVDTWFMTGPSRYVSDEDVAPICRARFPADTAPSALAPIIVKAMAPMFETFRGYEASSVQVEETLAQVLDRRSPY